GGRGLVLIWEEFMKKIVLLVVFVVFVFGVVVLFVVGLVNVVDVGVCFIIKIDINLFFVKMKEGVIVKVKELGVNFKIYVG
ncbi:sugar ABC transporter, partial [Enterococcus hirae]